ncbi:hypothetical protein M5C90_24635 [Pseudomonas chlororaphis subsp. piscium]|nr:hypothetical protein M5C90_24635 [Pseudomonas chlororaphis subsp. piscium]
MPLNVMPQQNLLTLICAEVGTSKLSEAYLLAGATLEIPGASPSLLQAVQEELVSENNPVEVLVKAFHTAPVTSAPMFADGVKGVMNTDGSAVEFQIRRIGNAPEVFRVQFARVDVAKLILDTDQKIADLADRVHQLERNTIRVREVEVQTR